ncbi:MAG: nucleoside 2-deoxyribosyltransferase [Minisyncoccia bacterium]
MKIYFAGSIRGGRDDKELYIKIIELLKEYGQVLTEHIGNPNLSNQGEMDLDDMHIYERDIAWLKESDALVAEVSMHSAGVGYEIAFAESLKKKVLCLYKQGSERKISGMINGNKNLAVKTYKDPEELEEIFKNFFK